MEIALKRETTLSETSASIHKVDARQKKQIRYKKSAIASTKTGSKGLTSSPADQPKCYACGNTNHDFSNCRYKKYKCKKCNEMGHILEVCKKAQASTNYLMDRSQKSEASEEGVIEMFNLHGNQSIVESSVLKLIINLL